MTTRKRPKERVIEAILTRHQSGSLARTWAEDNALYAASKYYLGDFRGNQTLVAAATRHVGSWRQALAAAGIILKRKHK
jgi:hypothetical protein